ncbi:unnamed protein product [Pleuronectes platessa]|uniref:Uncharacterized protein n=1 Tax=Pleuronectes platessa TaxID=8262 RepID=A0A9N7TTF8_PLEPL|nr:unnamed protein product [Pleuronectes platessa]
MPWLVTAIQSHWLVMTLTKPFSAASAPVAPTARAAKETRVSSQMPVFHAFDTQSLTVDLPGSAESGEEKLRRLLDNLLIAIQKARLPSTMRWMHLVPEGGECH